MIPSACSFIVLVFTVSLHVSVYMAIFKCGIFYSHMLKGFCFAATFCIFLHVVTLCMFPSMGWVKYEVLLLIIIYDIFLTVICVFYLLVFFSKFSFVTFDGNITCNTHWTIQCRRMLKYSIKKYFICYFAVLFLWRLHNVDERVIKKCGAVGGIRTGRWNRSTQRKPPQYVILSIREPIWYYLSLNPGCRIANLAFICLSYATPYTKKKHDTV
jgi:hypothetical protein